MINVVRKKGAYNSNVGCRIWQWSLDVLNSMVANAMDNDHLRVQIVSPLSIFCHHHDIISLGAQTCAIHYPLIIKLSFDREEDSTIARKLRNSQIRAYT